MEGSVKSLIEAEVRARQIVTDAKNAKDGQAQEAETEAGTINTKHRQELQEAYAAEIEKVTPLLVANDILWCPVCVERAREGGPRSARVQSRGGHRVNQAAVREEQRRCR
jgi:hypothetical protein